MTRNEVYINTVGQGSLIGSIMHLLPGISLDIPTLFIIGDVLRGVDFQDELRTVRRRFPSAKFEVFFTDPYK